MTHFNLTTPNLSTGNFVPGTSRSPAIIWLDSSHKLTICTGLPRLDRIRRVSCWQYMSTRKEAIR